MVTLRVLRTFHAPPTALTWKLSPMAPPNVATSPDVEAELKPGVVFVTVYACAASA